MIKKIVVVISAAMLLSCSVTRNGIGFDYYGEPAKGASVVEDVRDCIKKKFDDCVFPEANSDNNETTVIPEGLSNEALEKLSKKMEK